ncbi:unnamed protein product [Dibothriocephalus latus]|uniref:Uncharacterized protein n=1 Tax=Dibothriocephalus latus TaxID=60516 RepID=A0A3P7LXE6_DIBLA|nr:unnamed protein product [Dibothriocephalus latus]
MDATLQCYLTVLMVELNTRPSQPPFYSLFFYLFYTEYNLLLLCFSKTSLSSPKEPGLEDHSQFEIVRKEYFVRFNFSHDFINVDGEKERPKN